MLRMDNKRKTYKWHVIDLKFSQLVCCTPIMFSDDTPIPKRTNGFGQQERALPVSISNTGLTISNADLTDTKKWKRGEKTNGATR